jgi:membrane protein DedA with SNARE-associated domain
MTLLDPKHAQAPPVPSRSASSPPGTSRSARSAAAPVTMRRGPFGWRPWHGRARTRDLLCVSAIAASALYSVATIPLTPMLITAHPLVLVLLAGSNASVVAAGAFAGLHGTPPVVVVMAALPAMMRSDPVLWWSGRLWGRRIVERLGRRGPRVTLAERRGSRFAAPVVAACAFLPGGTQSPLYAAAGWLGLPLPVFLLADAMGTALWVSLLTAFGYWLGGDGVAMAGMVSHYALLAICLPLLTAIAPHAWRAWRRARRGRLAASQACASPALGTAAE